MVITGLKRVSAMRKEQIHALEQSCFEKDGVLNSVFSDYELNFTKSLPAFFFASIGSKLIGVLTVFMPGDGSAEISALVLPEYRKKGVFTALFKQAKKTIKSLKCQRVLFVFTPGVSASDFVLKKIKASYEASEYKMQLSSVPAAVRQAAPLLETCLQAAREEDLPQIAKMDAQFFDSDYDFSFAWINELFSLEKTSLYKLLYKGMIVGTAAYVKESDGYSIFGVGVLPEYRGLHLGRELMTSLLKTIPDETTVLLQVSSNNSIAFELYKKLGFRVTAQQDFYLL